MNTSQIAACIVAIEDLAKASDSGEDGILEVLEGNIISEEDCGEIARLITLRRAQRRVDEAAGNESIHAGVWREFWKGD